MIVVPVAGETIAHLTNFHWYLMFATFWAIIANPRTVGWLVVSATVGAASALSDPLTALLLPSAAFAINRYRSRLHGFVVAAVVAGLAVQLLVVLRAEQLPRMDSSWGDISALFAFRVAGGLTIGDVHLTAAWLWGGWSVPVVAIVALTLLVVLTIAMTDGWRRVIVILVVANSIVFFAVSLLIRGTTSLVPVVGQPPPLGSGRYTLVPVLMLVVCVAVLLDLALTERTIHAAVAGGAATVWLGLAITANIVIAPLPNGPSWAESIQAARGECSVGFNTDVIVEIAPSPGWTVQLPCDDL
jgi:hypothetical protein